MATANYLCVFPLRAARKSFFPAQFPPLGDSDSSGAHPPVHVLSMKPIALGPSNNVSPNDAQPGLGLRSDGPKDLSTWFHGVRAVPPLPRATLSAVPLPVDSMRYAPFPR